MLQIILLCLTLAIAAYYYILNKRPKLVLPGPRGLPFVGFAPFLGNEPHKTYMELAKKYGPIFKVQLGLQDWVILNSRELIHEAFAKRGKFSSGRINSVILDELTEGRSPTFSEGHFWKTLREFYIRALRSYGPSAMEICAREEAEKFCEFLENMNGKPTDCELLMSMAVANVTCRVTMGKRYEYDDPAFQKILDAVTILVPGSKNSDQVRAMMQVAFLRHLPGYRESYKDVIKIFEIIRGEIRRQIAERGLTTSERDTNDIVNEYLMERKKMGPDDDVFTEDQVVSVVLDFIQASDTTTNTIRWCLIGLSTNQSVQEKIHREVVQMKEMRGSISVEDQKNLPNTLSYIHEILRYCTPTPINIPHKATEDFMLGGYKIPANSPIAANFWAVHRSPEYFKDPDRFCPERFLDEEGNFISSDVMIPFSVGSRRCIGEQLGRMEILVFLMHLVEKFKIVPDESKPPPSLDKGNVTLTYSPAKFHVKFITRSVVNGGNHGKD